MSEDLVNQLTLNFLISKNQLYKLNKKIKENSENNRKTDKELYGVRIQKLFADLLVNQSPEDLLCDVKSSFDFFIDKAIYYFKAKDNNELLEQQRITDETNNRYDPNEIHDDIDFEREERAIANGNYQEEDGEQEEEHLSDNKQSQIPIFVKQKFVKKNNSVGVDNIESLQLPLMVPKR